MKQNGVTDQHPRRQFCKALDLILQEKRDAHHQIILGGDFNEELGNNMHGMTGIVSKHNLTDLMQAHLGNEDEPATYARGSKRIDYIFATADIASLVRSCGAEPFNHRFFSDHRGLYVDLQLSGLFDRNLSPLASPKYRDIKSGHPRQIQTYITELKKLFNLDDISSRAKQLSLHENHQLAEQLDSDITKAMLQAGKACTHTS
jgi:hypothetical protein